MSIGKRLINLVRSNINSVFDRDGSRGGSAHIEELSDQELEAELLRRRHRRTAAERAAQNGGTAEEAWEEVERVVGDTEGRYRSTARRGHRNRSPGQPARDPRLAQLYAQLECPYGADLATVRKHYRAMMRKYHPDMHAGSDDRERIATDLSQRLTQSYNDLRRLLG